MSGPPTAPDEPRPMRSFVLHGNRNTGWVARAQAIHAAAVLLATFAVYLVAVQVNDDLPQTGDGPGVSSLTLPFALWLALIIPGGAVLAGVEFVRSRIAVPAGVAVGFGLRLLLLAAVVAGPMRAGAGTTPSGTTVAVTALAGLLAGFSAEALLVFRPVRSVAESSPPPEPDAAAGD